MELPGASFAKITECNTIKQYPKVKPDYVHEQMHKWNTMVVLHTHSLILDDMLHDIMLRVLLWIIWQWLVIFIKLSRNAVSNLSGGSLQCQVILMLHMNLGVKLPRTAQAWYPCSQGYDDWGFLGDLTTSSLCNIQKSWWYISYHTFIPRFHHICK